VGKTCSVKIELMKKSDIEQVFAIEQASFNMPWSRNLFLSEFRSPLVSSLLVSLDKTPDRTVTGYIVFWNVSDEMHILNLAVSPEVRRQGIARELLYAALKRARGRGAKRAFLEVRASNTAALAFYAGVGFTGTSLRRAYYDDPVEDAIVMTLEPGAFEGLVRERNIM
jgi:ribosomal-protein-alanine N-acetyltransferase